MGFYILHKSQRIVVVFIDVNVVIDIIDVAHIKMSIFPIWLIISSPSISSHRTNLKPISITQIQANYGIRRHIIHQLSVICYFIVMTHQLMSQEISRLDVFIHPSICLKHRSIAVQHHHFNSPPELAPASFREIKTSYAYFIKINEPCLNQSYASYHNYIFVLVALD